MTTALKEKKSKKRKGEQVVAAAASAAVRPPAEILGDLQALRAKRDELKPWDDEEREAIDVKIATLNDELALSQFAELPAPEPFAMKVIEQDVQLADIVITGNHREQAENEADIARLSRSLQIVGLQQRIGVRDMGDGKFELIFGSRRRAAASYINWASIPAKVYPQETTPDQVELLRDIENFNRKDLTPVERAIAVARTIDTVEKMAVPGTDDGRKLIASIEAVGGRDAYVGQLLGYPATWVRDHAYVSKLGSKARELLSARRISIDHARELAKLGDAETADDFADRAARKPDGTGGSTAEDVRQWVIEELRSLKSVPWRLDVAMKGKGSLPVPCESCEFNTKSDPLLFEHEVPGEDDPAGLTTAAGVCRNGSCFTSRQELAKDAIEAGLKEVAKAVKKADDGITLTEKGLADFIPVTIRGGTFARKAKATIDAETGGIAKPIKSGGNGRHDEPPPMPEEIASKKYNDAFDAWQRASSKKLAAKVNAEPLRKLYFILVSELGLFRKLRHSSPYLYGDRSQRKQQLESANKANDKAREMVKSGELKSMVKKIEEPTLKDLESLVKSMSKVEGREFADLVDAGIEAFAKAMDVELDEAPKLETFLEAEQAKNSKDEKSPKKSAAGK